MGGGAGGPARAGRRAHRLGQDARGVPVGARPAGRRRRRRPIRSTAAGCCTSRRSRRWRSTCSATCARRSPASGRRRSGSALPVPDITVGMRTGDTPADERRLFARTPPDVLVTTPESLFLLLTSAARESLRGVRTVILDEVHAVAGTKRGAHLALSLERLDALLEDRAGPAHRAVGHGPAARRGLHLPGRGAPGRGRAAAHPEDDRGDRRGAGAGSRRARRAAGAGLVRRGGHRLGGRHGAAAVDLARGGAAAAGAGPAAPVDDRVRQLPAAGRAADGAAQRAGGRGGRRGRRPGHRPERGGARIEHFPAEAIGQSGIGGGAPAIVAKAHHGSMSREQRTLVEEELKAGLLPCVVATSSLELGIDMGAVDLVVQVEAPPSVASGLQRVGRAGHQVGAVSRGVVFPKYRGDLVSCAVVAERMTAGGDRVAALPAQPARRAGPAHRGDGRAGAVDASATWPRWCAGPPRSPRCPTRRCTRCSTCWPGATRPRSSASCGRGSPGTGSPTSCAAARARSGWRSPPAARSRTAGCSPS